MPTKSGVGVGGVSLACAILPWLTCSVAAAVEFGYLPKTAATHSEAMPLAIFPCLTAAVAGGIWSALATHCKAGYLALPLVLLYLLTVFSCFALMFSGLLGSGWLD